MRVLTNVIVLTLRRQHSAALSTKGNNMGFWKQLFGVEEIPQGLPKPTRPAPPMPAIKEPKKDISEPVLSIIQTLKDGEWSFKSYGLCGEIICVTHEWFGNYLTVYVYEKDRYFKTHCTAEWMTQEEKEAVGDICWQIYQGRKNWEKEQSLAKQRESFMNLTEKY